MTPDPLFKKRTCPGAGSGLAQEQEDSSPLPEVVVATARKISENIQEVPVAVTALSADWLTEQGISDLSGISKVTTARLL